MRRNNFQNFNPRLYEDNLSPFGRQVLSTLINQWNIGNESKNEMFRVPQPRRQRQYHAHNRIISFGESHPNINEIMTIPNQLASFDDDSDVGLPIGCPPISPSGDRAPRSPAVSVACSSDLLATAQVSNSTSTQRYPQTQKDLIIPIDNINVDGPPNIFDERHKSLDEQDALKLDNRIEIVNKNISENNNGQRNVDWDNMFDTELLLDIGGSAPDDEMLGVADANLRSDGIGHIPKNSESIEVSSIQPHDKKIDKPSKNLKENKKPKCKNQAKITDAIPKKVKTSDFTTVAKPKVTEKKVPKMYMRKQTSKSVANWLNDVDAKNPVEDSDDHVNGESHTTEIETITITHKPIENNIIKKIVQTRLANRDGVMKFKKPNVPKVDDTGEGKTTENEVSNKEIVKIKDTIKKTDTVKSKPKGKETETVKAKEAVKEKQTAKEKEAVKDKKTKSKFVAPIKSQLPVKDIIYDIRVVEDENISPMKDVVQEEITAVLLYSNGFSQLNSHHTDANLVPEGVLLHAHDTFYYCMGAGSNLKDLFSRIIKHNTIICYDCKTVLVYLMAKYDLEFEITLNIMDVKIAAGVVWADSETDKFPAIQALAGTSATYTVATDCPRQKAAWYCDQLRDCARALRTLLQEDSLSKLYTQIEMPLLPIIAGMEYRGVRIDVERLKQMESTMAAQLKAAEKRCHTAAGRPFQVTSAPQLRTLLYEELHLDTRANLNVRGTDVAGAKSTAEDMLKRVSGGHELPALVLEYRRLKGGHAALAGLAAHCTHGVVRPVWQQLAAATGRMGCCSPNMQALPKAPIQLNEDDNCASPGSVSVRAAVIPGPGCVLLSADYLQVECRVWAHQAADDALRAALSAADLFRELAARWMNCDPSAVTSSDRERTKRLVYATLYGAGVRKLMDILDVDYQRALDISGSFYRQFPSLKRFGTQVLSCWRSEGGQVRAASGRRRALAPGGGAAARQHAERQAVNFVVQGCAADVCKLAMSGAHEQLRARGLQARLLLQLHDELVWEVPVSQLKPAAAVIAEAMETSGSTLGLPRLPVALAVGSAWGELQPYVLDSRTE